MSRLDARSMDERPDGAPLPQVMSAPRGGIDYDVVNHPSHYGTVPGVECIDVVEHFPFCRGNAIKYLWRAGVKGDLVEDLRKAIWYIEREIAAHTS